jgi:V8-like Glu-specific endopeptidase
MEADDHARVASVMRHLKRLADKEASAPTEEALKLFDPRTPVDRVAHPEYEPIGLVETLEVRRDLGGFGRGSGWLTSDCLVVTAQHLFDPDKPVIGTAVKFLVGSPPTENDNFRFKTTGKVVATGKSLREDWALVRLDRSLGKQVGKIKTWQYSVDDAKSCVALETAGYPGEKPVDKLWWQTACHLDAELSSPGNFEIDCPVTHGQSGGPLLCRETNGELRAIGLIKSQGFGVYLHAVNFTFDWQNAIKPALQKFARDCPAN